EALERARNAPLSRWLFALAIPEVGKTTATQLAAFHKTIEDVADSSLLRDVRDFRARSEESKEIRKSDPARYARLKSEIAAMADRLVQAGFAAPSKSKNEKEGAIVTEVGPAVAESVLAFFRSSAGQKTLRKLKQYGISPKSELASRKKAAGGPLAGKTFVLTGTLPGMTREEATGKIEAAGGRVSGGVSRKTDYVLTGESAGSKLDKARELSVPVIDEAAFRKLIA
ncbi:MAG TPA: BRCT domain-containing protein, partial [Chthoniobacteraceae bacterium]